MYTDIVIIGAGIAGLYTALNIDSDKQIVIVTKEEICACNSYLAQGGIAVVRDDDDIQTYIDDTCRAGGYTNSIDAVNVLVNESRDNINRLIELGVMFDKEGGNLDYTKEAAHSINRIVHCKDKTGAIVHETLIKKCKEKNNIIIKENCVMEDLLITDNKCLGIKIRDIYGTDNILAQSIVMATGGVGGLFKSTTNKTNINGDGMAIAISHNVIMKDIDKIQFHPTALYENGKKQRFLISESVRGEGAILVNSKGKRFVDELLPRDVVSKAIWEEIKQSGESNVYLDARHMGEGFIKNRFPTIYSRCLDRGLDITKELIPVVPAQHYIMGGIKVDLDAKTSVHSLYAVGEVSCTGVHGNNRLASNSLLESLVFSNRLAKYINTEVDTINTMDTTVLYEDNLISTYSMNKKTHCHKKILKDTILGLRGDLKDELCDY